MEVFLRHAEEASCQMRCILPPFGKNIIWKNINYNKKWRKMMLLLNTHFSTARHPKPGFGLPDSSLVVRRIKKSSLFPPKLEIFVVGFRVRWVKVEHKFPCKWSQNWIDGIAYWNICSLLKIEFSKESESLCPHVIVFGACHDNEATSSQPLSRDSF